MACETGCEDEGSDRISELPDVIREIILGYLPISDAVRTGVLSRTWKCSWKRAVQLNVYFNGIVERKMSRHRYHKIVGSVLRSHLGPMHKFVLSITEGELSDDFSPWLELLSRKGVKDLTFESGFRAHDSELPITIFQCSELLCLTLRKFTLGYSVPFCGFPNLVKLHLFHVSIYEDYLEKLVSSCPLEILFIESCCFFSDSMDGRCDCDTAIYAPNLRVPSIVCSDHCLCCICLKYTPNLRMVSFTTDAAYSEMYRLESSCFDVLRSMPKVEEFSFECPLHKSSTSSVVPISLPESLLHLKTLTLYTVDVISMDQMSFVFCIIRSSPNLRNLTIHMTNWRWEGFNKDALKYALAILEAEAKVEIKTSITTISITLENTERITAELALIDHMVSRCPTLRELLIKGSALLKYSSKLKLSRLVRKFSQSSSNLKINYA